MLVNEDPFNIQGNFHEFENDRFIDQLNNISLGHSNEVGTKLNRFNGATRINAFNEEETNLQRKPKKVIAILRYLEDTLYVKPSMGLKYQGNYRKSSYLHFVVEQKNGRNIGIFYHIQNRPLPVNKIYDIEKAITKLNLDECIIFSDKVGLPAIEATNRINLDYSREIIKIKHVGSILKLYD